MTRLRLTTAFLTVLIVAISNPACTRAQSESGPAATAEDPATRVRSAVPAEEFSEDRPLAQPRHGTDQRVAANNARPAGSLLAENDDEEEKYWGHIKFGGEQFDEVLENVENEYIEEKTDMSRGYVSAANFALSLLEPPYELIPQSYYEDHKDDPEIKLEGDNRDELNTKRRKLFRARHDSIQAAWSKVKFGRGEFERVMAFATKEGERSKKKKRPSDRLWLAAAQGFLYALDPHSSLLSKKAWEDSMKETQDASFDGIGALLTQRFEPSNTLQNRLDGKIRKLGKKEPFLFVQLDDEDKLRRRTFVESPLPGQPAVKAGLWAGDEIFKVDGVSVVDMPLDKVVSLIRGKRGTEVKLTVQREGVPGELTINVTRAHIRSTNVEGRLLEHHPCVGYVKLTGFIESSFETMSAEINKMQEQCKEGSGLRGLVFDLRTNSGGLLSQGQLISDLFLEKGIIVTVKNRRRASSPFMRSDEVFNARPNIPVKDASIPTLTMPMVVLVNDGSASASEIVASAFQDNQRALIVGERTFGKASVQTLINPYRGKGYYIKLTIARYYSPSGRTLQVVGVNPDVEVPPEIDGKMPLGFREEDLSNHLPQIDTEYTSANTELTGQLTACVKKRGIAEHIHQDNPNPQIKFDYQLYRGADYLECLIDHMAPDEPDIVDLTESNEKP
jgi:C-terminal peptidase prc